MAKPAEGNAPGDRESAHPSRSVILHRFHESAAYQTFLQRTRGAASVANALYSTSSVDPENPNKCVDTNRMSPMGQLAARAGASVGAAPGRRQVHVSGMEDNDPFDEGEDGYSEGPAGGQAEVSLAVDSTGNHIVVGVNDTRGFSTTPVSVSGFFYSDDGGATFTDAGQLPVNVGLSTQQVFGDPEVKYMGGSNFIYFSILVTAAGAQSMCVHRSTDNGHTWTGPFEITPATLPHTGDAADKEFADVDPETGRVLLSWTNFRSTGAAEMSATYSDNVMSATPPTWSARAVLSATSADGQASVPRFAGNGSNNAYIAWRRFTSSFLGLGQNVGFVRSTDNGVTWSAPINTTTDFFTEDHILGNDRNNTSPVLAVDTTSGPYSGTLYLVYADNDNTDGSDIAFQKSVDGGVSWSPLVFLDARPGNDRPQWFPWVNVDINTGRVYVFYNDQQIAATGDLMEVLYQYSDDGGTTWTRPAPLSTRPFHAAWGNDTGQPNLGDYSQAVAQNGELFAAFAITEPKPFTDGQPTSASMTTPDVFVRRISTQPVALSLGNVTFTDAGANGFIDAGEHALLTIPLQNYVTNAINSGTITGISAVLSSTTTGVTVPAANSAYPNIAAGGSASNATQFDIALNAATFTVGSDIELVLTVTTAQGSTALPFTLHSGTPVVQSTLLSENFSGVSAPALPVGWATSHGGGSGTTAWKTDATFMGTGSNAAFHVNAGSGAAPGGTRFERLFSPQFNVPSSSRFVTVDFDTVYDTEDETTDFGGGKKFNVWAYDGYTLRVTDLTPGSLLRSVLAEAFETEMYTGTAQHQPKHLPRNSSTSYLQDMSVWAGYSNGVKPVHMRLPGMQGTTAQLRFEYTQDSAGKCTDAGHPAQSVTNPCGVAFTNLVVKSWSLVTQPAVVVSAVTGQYSDAVTLTATVTPGTTSAGTATGSIAFKVNGVAAGSASINGSGVATVPYTIGLSQGPYTIDADFTSTNADFTNASGSGTLTVTREDAAITPDPNNGNGVVVNTGNGTASFTLAATAAEMANGPGQAAGSTEQAGNICNASVPSAPTITLTPLFPGAPIVQNATVTCVAGVFTFSYNFTGVPLGQYATTFDLHSDYFSGTANGIQVHATTTQLTWVNNPAGPPVDAPATVNGDYLQTFQLRATVLGPLVPAKLIWSDNTITWTNVVAGQNVATRSFVPGAGTTNYWILSVNDDPSRQSPKITVQQTTGATHLTLSAPGSVVYQQTVTLTGTVTSNSGTPDGGAVNFYDNGGVVPFATATVVAGTATANVLPGTYLLTLGSHTITTSYAGGGSLPWLVSMPATANVTVTKASTTTGLTSSASTVQVSTGVAPSVLFTAPITVNAPGSASPNAPTGTVTFTDVTASPNVVCTATIGGSPLKGVTSACNAGLGFYTAAPTLGVHTIQAVYSGDANFNGSSSSTTVIFTANPATTTALGTSPGSSTYGDPVTLTATVTNLGGQTPPGSVTFYDGVTSIGTSLLSSGVATLTTKTLTGGGHSLTAKYNPSGSLTTSTSTPATSFSVTKATPTIVVSATPASSVFGQSVSLKATITGASGVSVPTGIITLHDGSSVGPVIGSGTIAGGIVTASTATLTAGSHTITATYPGDTNYALSSGASAFMVNPGSTTTALAGSPVNPVKGQTVTLTATVKAVAPAAGTPTGNVVFCDGAYPCSGPAALGSGALNGSGVASITTTALTVGAHTVTATYVATTNFATSTGSWSTTVLKASTTTTITSATPNPIARNAMMNVSITVAAVTGYSGIPGGSVTLKDVTSGATWTGTLNGAGVVSFSTVSFSTTGAHSLQATYAGAAGYNGSTSSSVGVTVTP